MTLQAGEPLVVSAYYGTRLSRMHDFDIFTLAYLRSLLILHRSSVSLGAIITLLALALDSFFQQSVGYSYVTVEDTSQRALSVTANTYGVDNVAEYRADSANEARKQNTKAPVTIGIY